MVDLTRHSDVIDMTTFDQILEMDDDEEEFSKSIVLDFFTQAKNTFKDMDEALKEENLKSLSELGHFLKGSSATLGLIKVKDSCEKIQHYGAGLDATGHNEEKDDKKSLRLIRETIAQAKDEVAEVEKIFKDYYGEE